MNGAGSPSGRTSSRPATQTGLCFSSSVMRCHPVLPPLRLLLLAAFIDPAAGVAHTQELQLGVRQGTRAEELQAALPGLQRVPRPLRLAGGLAGLWHGAPAPNAGLLFEPVYYLAGGQLRRVEWVA